MKNPLQQVCVVGLGYVGFVDDPFSTRKGHYDAVVLAVPYKVFRERRYEEYLSLMSALAQGVFVDLKGVYLGDARADSSTVLELVRWHAQW